MPRRSSSLPDFDAPCGSRYSRGTPEHFVGGSADYKDRGLLTVVLRPQRGIYSNRINTGSGRAAMRANYQPVQCVESGMLGRHAWLKSDENADWAAGTRPNLMEIAPLVRAHGTKGGLSKWSVSTQNNCL